MKNNEVACGIATGIFVILAICGVGAAAQAIAAEGTGSTAVPGCAVLSPGIVCCPATTACPPSTGRLNCTVVGTLCCPPNPPGVGCTTTFNVEGVNTITITPLPPGCTTMYFNSGTAGGTAGCPGQPRLSIGGASQVTGAPNITNGSASRVTITDGSKAVDLACTVAIKEGDRTLVEVPMTDCTRLKVELRKP